MLSSEHLHLFTCHLDHHFSAPLDNLIRYSRNLPPPMPFLMGCWPRHTPTTTPQVPTKCHLYVLHLEHGNESHNSTYTNHTNLIQNVDAQLASEPDYSQLRTNLVVSCHCFIFAYYPHGALQSVNVVPTSPFCRSFFSRVPITPTALRTLQWESVAAPGITIKYAAVGGYPSINDLTLGSCGTRNMHICV